MTASSIHSRPSQCSSRVCAIHKQYCPSQTPGSLASGFHAAELTLSHAQCCWNLLLLTSMRFEFHALHMIGKHSELQSPAFFGSLRLSHRIAQALLQPSSSACQVLGLQMNTTTPAASDVRPCYPLHCRLISSKEPKGQ